MPLILSTHELHPRAAQMLCDIGELRFASSPDPATLLREGVDADAIIVRAPLPAELFERAPNLRAAIRHGAGLDMVPMAAATKAGVLVANVPGVNARSVAEHVFFVAMALLRRFRVIDRDLREKGWAAGRSHALATRELAGLTLGIVGFGNIGRQVCGIGRDGFGLDVLIHTRSRTDAPEGARFASLEETIAGSDIVVLCCPLTDETRGMIDAERIALMKPDALVVNIARGPVVVDDALIAALREGRIGGAALDVFAEQPLSPDHPYFAFDNVIVTPHVSGITEGSMMRMGVGAAEETARVFRGELPVNFCNPEVLDAYRKRFPQPPGGRPAG